MKKERMEKVCKRMMIVGAIGYVITKFISESDIVVTINNIEIINNNTEVK